DAGAGGGSVASARGPTGGAVPSAAGAMAALACGATPAGSRGTTPLAGATKVARNGYRLFDGWSFHRDPAGFGVAVPDGWAYFRAGAATCFRDPEGVRVLSVDPSRRPGTDPLTGCRREEARLRAALPGYARVRLDRVPRYRAGAEWDYTYAGAGAGMQARTVWFVASDRHAYAVGWATRRFDWRVNVVNFDMIMGSFAPAVT
ncbi:MAG TPA: hypothetical protein VES42_13220, partial [Pilimelia sp.]|nr:hypothetical protein [Pilimelia sp.]